MTLNQLEYFCAVCRYRSITRAANELFVSQPTVSLAMRELEKEFGLSFFNHGKNKITLTADGERFYEEAEKLLQQSRTMVSEFSELANIVRPVKIGIPPLISTVFFPRMIDAFHETYDTPVQLFEFGSVRACNMVNSGELDLALVNLDFYKIQNFNYHILMEDSTTYCVSRTHPFADKDSITVDMLKDEDVIFLNTDSVQNQTITTLYQSKGLHPHVILHSSQLYTTLNFVRSGTCGAFLYSSLAVNPRDFVKIPMEPNITTQFGLVWNTKTLDEHVKYFVDFAKRYDIEQYVK